MEQNLPIVTRKLWKLMKVAIYMLRKSMNKKKILLDLNLFIKRGKFVAGKTLTNLMMFHHHMNSNNSNVFELNDNGEYEFSCTNTPLYNHYFTKNSKHQHKISVDEAVNNMWGEIMVLASKHDERESKACRRSPMVRQLRITDSPYPMQSEGGNYTQVDEAAEEFIKRFYLQLKEQTC